MIGWQRPSRTPAGKSITSLSSSLTSTDSRTLTTHWGTRSETCYCKELQSASRNGRVSRTLLPVWVAMNFLSCCLT